MPSSQTLAALELGYGRLHRNVATASAHRFNEGTGSAAILSSVLAAITQELATVAVSADTVSAGDTSLIISGSDLPFVGDNPSEPLINLFRLVDDSDQMIYDASGTFIRVLSISGASVGDGFTTANVTVNFTSTIPVGVTYRVYYGVRKTLNNLPADAMSYPAIRRSPQVEHQVQDLLKDLHDDAGIPIWDDAWISTIGSLARSGLNERYRRQTVGVTGNLDTPGDGATIVRDGIAPTVAVVDSTAIFADPVGAGWKVDTPFDDGGTFPLGQTTGVGFVHYASDRTSNESQEHGAAVSAGSFASLWPHNHVGDFAGTPKTQINPTRAAALNPGSAGGDIVELHASDFFYNGSNQSAVNTGYDLLEITRNSGAVEVYCIVLLDTGDARRCTVRDLANNTPAFPADEAVTVRWITTKFWQGPSLGIKDSQITAAPYVPLLGSLMHFAPPRNTTVSPLLESFPIFSAHQRSTDAVALAFGGHEADATSGAPGFLLNLVAQNRVGYLKGDGGIRTSGLSDLGATAWKNQGMTVSVTGSQQWDLDVKPCLDIYVTVTAQTLTLTLPATVPSTVGTMCKVIVRLAPGVGTFTLLWPSGGAAEFYFSSAGDKTPTQGAGSVTVYDGVAVATDYYMTKTSFPSGGVQGP